jgi:hypothetical protein
MFILLLSVTRPVFPRERRELLKSDAQGPPEGWDRLSMSNEYGKDAEIWTPSEGLRRLSDKLTSGRISLIPPESCPGQYKAREKNLRGRHNSGVGAERKQAT